MGQEERLAAWIARNRPQEPRLGVTEDRAEYDRQWAAYAVAQREYSRKIDEIAQRHGISLGNLPEGLAFADGVPNYRRFESVEKKGGR